jgi:hypothetical protein
MSERDIKRQQKVFTDRLISLVRNGGTEAAEFDCELCQANTKLTAFTCFMYPDHSIKALCNPCAAREYIRLDYGNKN